MIYEIGRSECGCIVQQSNAGVYISYCPKHGAAPELYEACRLGKEVALALSEYNSKCKDSKPPLDVIKQVRILLDNFTRLNNKALAKAEVIK